jgi:hypothetical protein
MFSYRVQAGGLWDLCFLTEIRLGICYYNRRTLLYFLTSDPRNDPYRFKGEGVVFNAKLIGLSDVADARGDRMCQETILAQKMAVKSSGQHKQRIIINISEEGIKLIDLRTAVSNAA